VQRRQIVQFLNPAAGSFVNQGWKPGSAMNHAVGHEIRSLSLNNFLPCSKTSNLREALPAFNVSSFITGKDGNRRAAIAGNPIATHVAEWQIWLLR
jgi:hypothetical protein